MKTVLALSLVLAPGDAFSWAQLVCFQNCATRRYGVKPNRSPRNMVDIVIIDVGLARSRGWKIGSIGRISPELPIVGSLMRHQWEEEAYLQGVHLCRQPVRHACSTPDRTFAYTNPQAVINGGARGGPRTVSIRVHPRRGPERPPKSECRPCFFGVHPHSLEPDGLLREFLLRSAGILGVNGRPFSLRETSVIQPPSIRASRSAQPDAVYTSLRI